MNYTNEEKKKREGKRRREERREEERGEKRKRGLEFIKKLIGASHESHFTISCMGAQLQYKKSFLEPENLVQKCSPQGLDSNQLLRMN